MPSEIFRFLRDEITPDIWFFQDENDGSFHEIKELLESTEGG
jgi:hypothetical protein